MTLLQIAVATILTFLVLCLLGIFFFGKVCDLEAENSKLKRILADIGEQKRLCAEISTIYPERIGDLYRSFNGTVDIPPGGGSYTIQAYIPKSFSDQNKGFVSLQVRDHMISFDVEPEKVEEPKKVYTKKAKRRRK